MQSKIRWFNESGLFDSLLMVEVILDVNDWMGGCIVITWCGWVGELLIPRLGEYWFLGWAVEESYGQHSNKLIAQSNG